MLPISEPVARGGLVRRAGWYAGLAGGTILAGLASRRYGAALPGWMAAYAGDALWALLVFWLVGLLRPRWPSHRVAGLAWGLAVAVEASQLYQGAWLVALRRTTLGGLVLGQSFLWSDVLCYTVGVLGGYVAERVSWLWLRGKGRPVLRTTARARQRSGSK